MRELLKSLGWLQYDYEAFIKGEDVLLFEESVPYMYHTMDGRLRINLYRDCDTYTDYDYYTKTYIVYLSNGDFKLKVGEYKKQSIDK